MQRVLDLFREWKRHDSWSKRFSSARRLLVCTCITMSMLSSLLPMSHLQAQNRRIDSLKSAIQTELPDSTLVKAYCLLSFYYRRFDTDTCLYYAQKAEKKASEGDHLRSMGNSYQALATAYYSKSEYRKSLSYNEKAYNIYSQIGRVNQMSSIRNNQAIIHKNLGELDQSLKYHYESLALKNEIGFQSGIASSYLNIGAIYKTLGEYDSALINFIRSLEIKEQLNDSTGIATLYNNMGLVKFDLKDYDGASEYFNQSIEIRRKLNDREGLASSFTSLGLILQQKELYDSAAGYLKNALPIYGKLDQKLGESTIHKILGSIYLDQNQLDAAINSFETSLQLKKLIGDRIGESEVYNYLAKTYQQKNDLTSAIKWGLDAIQLARKLNAKIEARDASKLLNDLYTQSSNFNKAHQYLNLYQQYQDSIANEGRLLEIAQIESKHLIEKISSQNSILEKEAQLKSETIRTQRVTVISTISIGLLIAAIAILQIRQLKRRKKLLKQVESQATKLRELDQAKSRFFANVSHDLRSPLTLIMAGLDQISEDEFSILSKDSLQLLETGHKNGRRLLYLAEEIMELTRLEEGKMQLNLELVLIDPYLKLLTKMFGSAANMKSIDLKYTSEIDSRTIVELDPRLFEKIIYNLLSNALKFTPVNGNISVNVENDNKKVLMKISNTGSGIPAESLELIFDRFYQLMDNIESSQVGVGIGLALVKELVELHGGTIQAMSSDKLTTFQVSMPLFKGDSAHGVIPEGSLDIITRNSLWSDLIENDKKIQIPSLSNSDADASSILIVEDHKELRYYLRGILSNLYRVHLASDGSKALEILEKNKIQLIITDLMMPYMDGFELVDHLKEDKELKKIPVLVVSARTDPKEKLELLSKGADEVMNKPFDKDELIVRINNLLKRKWDNSKTLNSLYGENIRDYEKSVMSRLEQLIIRRIDDPMLAIDDLADEMAASRRNLYRMLKKISGLTPYELIKEVRWQYLEKYLADNNVYTATEAARLIGMNNVSSFADQFKKRFGYPIGDSLSQ